MANGEDSFSARQPSPGSGGFAPSPGEEDEQPGDTGDDEPTTEEDGFSARQPSPGSEGFAPSPGEEDEQTGDTGDDEPTTEEDGFSARQPSPGSEGFAPSPGEDDGVSEPQQSPGTEGFAPSPDEDDSFSARQPSPGSEGFAPSPDEEGEQAAFTPEEARAEERGVTSVTPSPSRTAQRQAAIASGPGPRVRTTEIDADVTTQQEEIAEELSGRSGASIGTEDIDIAFAGPSGTRASELPEGALQSIGQAGGMLRPTIFLSGEARRDIREAQRDSAAPEMGPQLAESEDVSLGSGGRPKELISEAERRERVTEATTTGGFLGPEKEESLEGLAQGYSETFREFFESDPAVEGQTEQPQDVFLEGAAQTAVEIGNVPGILSSVETGANVATGAPTILQFPGTTGQLAGETAVSRVQGAAQFAQEEPLRAGGILGGVAVTAGASAAGASQTGVRGTAQAARAAARGDVELPSGRQLIRRAGREAADELDPRVTPFGDFRGATSTLARRFGGEGSRGRRLARQFAAEERGQAQLLPRGVREERPSIGGEDSDILTIGGEDADITIREPTVEPGQDPRNPAPSIPPQALRRQRSAVRSSFADADADVLGTSFVPGFRAIETGGLAFGQRLRQAQEPSVDFLQAQRQRPRVDARPATDIQQRVRPFQDTDVDGRERQDQDIDVRQRTGIDIDLVTRTDQGREAREATDRAPPDDRRDPTGDRDREIEVEENQTVESVLGGPGFEQEQFEFESAFDPLGR